MLLSGGRIGRAPLTSGMAMMPMIFPNGRIRYVIQGRKKLKKRQGVGNYRRLRHQLKSHLQDRRKVKLMHGIDLKKIPEKMNGALGAELKQREMECLLYVAIHIAEFKPSRQTFADGVQLKRKHNQVTLRDDMAKSFYKDVVMSLGPSIIATMMSMKVAHYEEFFLPEELLPPKKHGRDQSSSSTPTLHQEFEMGERSQEAYKITWVEFKKLLIKKYYPRTEIQNMEDEFYHLTVKGIDLMTYVRRFQELAALCPTIMSDSEKIIKLLSGDYLEVLMGMLSPLKLKL
nr:reverse transcriptase domain-containing protein [Tanacetum cinerariifolium]